MAMLRASGGRLGWRGPAATLPSYRRPQPKKKRDTGYIFGAVYEHRDACGKPKLINSTSGLPEQQYLEDGRARPDVSRLLTPGRAGHPEVKLDHWIFCLDITSME